MNRITATTSAEKKMDKIISNECSIYLTQNGAKFRTLSHTQTQTPSERKNERERERGGVTGMRGVGQRGKA